MAYNPEMNVFILNTGRCGSTTFIKACEHITNFTAGHETRCRLVGQERLEFPPRHIEADNRLSWILGRLDQRFGDDAHYVHLHRSVDATARSFVNRFHSGIMRTYTRGILMTPESRYTQMEIARDYCDTITTNIQLFLRGKTRVMDFPLEQAEDQFTEFWRWIGAQGDLEAALKVWRTPHNATGWRDRLGTWRRNVLSLFRLPRRRFRQA